MSSTPVVFASTDAGSPVVTGQVNSIPALLRTLLIGTAGIAYGGKAALGWTEPFAAASNTAVFRNNSSVGSGSYFQFEDNGSSAGGAKTCVVRGYKAMSALTTGTDAFPTVGQESAGLYVRKSETANSTARAWWAIGTRRWLYLFIDSNSSGLDTAACFFFGDLDTIRPADAYHGAIAAGRIADPSTAQDRSLFLINATSVSASPVGTTTGFYVAGAQNQVASSTGVALVNPYGTAGTIGGSAGFSYPHAPNNGLLFGRVLVTEGTYAVRGWMPALLAPWHNQVLTDLTSLPSVPESGKTSISKRTRPRAASVTGAGELLFDTTTAY